MPRRSIIAQSLLIDTEALDELTETFPTINDGYIKRADFREAMGKLGLTITGHEERDYLTEIPADEEQITVDTFMMLHAKVKEKKDLSRIIKKEKVLSGKAELVAEQDDMSKHTVSLSEERGFSDWMNRSLKDDEVCKPKLPIIKGELYDKCTDGILLCKLINKAKPGTIDERTLNTGSSLKSLFKRNENLVLAINSAEAMGCHVVNVFPQSIADCRKHLVLGLVWQIIRNGLLGSINLTHHSELVALLRDGETIEDLRRLSPEELLIRWVNYHLERAGIDRRITNFRNDIMDSEIYSHLLQQVAPADKKDVIIPPVSILSSNDNMTRAGQVLQNAETLDAAAFLQPEDIAKVTEKHKNRERLNLVFVANLFNTYPALDPPEDVEIIEETLEEQTYRNWMNSLGVSPYVNHLYTDLNSGLVFLQLFDILKPGMVDWSKIKRVFDPKKKIFQMQDNCAYVVEYAREYKLKVVNLSGEDIRQGEKNLNLGLCFQMMRAYTLKLLSLLRGDGKPMEDKDIVVWVNQKLSAAGKTTKISGFKDQQISTAVPVIDLVDSISPGSVDYSLVTGNKEKDCRFAISMARKIGARVYALPQHLETVNQKMVMTVFACLMVVDYQNEKSKE